MGKGDKKSRKGKLWKGTFGKLRPHRTKKAEPVKKKAKR
ncbi:MAG: 30S ribosomal protein THX [Bacteroidetes bacterium]|nr:30S ribosomal protein THX [Bacteroidota bacterium]